jgi:predicted MFS family arabinose efflux permease
VFLDLSLGITGPLAGYIAGAFGYRSVYLFAALAAVVAVGLTAMLHQRSMRSRGASAAM